MGGLNLLPFDSVLATHIHNSRPLRGSSAPVLALGSMPFIITALDRIVICLQQSITRVENGQGVSWSRSPLTLFRLGNAFSEEECIFCVFVQGSFNTIA